MFIAFLNIIDNIAEVSITVLPLLLKTKSAKGDLKDLI